MSDPTTELRSRVLEVLEAADDPLPVGRIQRRVATGGFDATTGAVREVCTDLVDEGRVEFAGTPPAYQLVE